MNTENSIYRKVLMSALVCLIAAAVVSANDPRLELRHREDSIDVAKQSLKRQGKPIEDLEAAAAALRDSLRDLRGETLSGTSEDAAQDGGSFWDFLPHPENLRPRGAFDWVIVVTGVVAFVSLLALVVGLLTSKKKTARDRKKKGGRKINLATTGSYNVVPGARTFSSDNDGDILPQPASRADSQPPAAGTLYGRSGRMDDREPSAGLPSDVMERFGLNIPQEGAPADPQDSAPSAPRDRTADIESLVETLRKVAPPPPEEEQPEPPAPPPLVADAPDDYDPPIPPFAGLGAGAASASRRDTVTIPSPKELVTAAYKKGLSEQEIAKRYQLSVDQVKLILRMSRA